MVRNSILGGGKTMQGFHQATEKKNLLPRNGPRTARASFPRSSDNDLKWSLRLTPLSVRDALNSKSETEKKRHSAEMKAQGITASSEFCDFEGWGINDVYVLRLLAMSPAEAFNSCKVVNFAKNRIEGPCIQPFMDRLREHEVTSINLSNNRFSTKYISALNRCIKKFSHLQHLNLNGCPLGDAIVELCQVLSEYCVEIEGLGLENCHLGSTSSGKALQTYLLTV